ncbi:MAG: YlxR family protein [Firmicutes bacterium]|nr:YlxR family protein [Bacillota bacterium]
MAKHKIYDEKGNKVSVRMCIACRQNKVKDELIRVAKTSDGIISIDVDRSAGGRGAYVCNNAKCIEKSQKLSLIQKNLKAKVDKEIYEVLLGIER